MKKPNVLPKHLGQQRLITNKVYRKTVLFEFIKHA